MHLRYLTQLCRSVRGIVILVLMFFTLPATGDTKEAGSVNNPGGMKSGWSTFLQGGYVHQFKTDMDAGGSFTTNRLFIQGGATYSPEYQRSIALSLGYGFDGYDFSGDGGFSGLRPWEDIHSFRISMPVRWGVNQKWTWFLIPTLRFSGENGADLDDSMFGGGFAGFSYRFSDRLTIGPGIGIITQIEDDATVFPVIILKWKITDRLSLETGRGLGATLGPGLLLSWKASEAWNVAIGGRYENLRFRLDKNGIAPNGVGDDRSLPVFGGLTYNFSRQAQASLIGGVELDGELRLDDRNGNQIAKEKYDTALFLGFAANIRF